VDLLDRTPIVDLLSEIGVEVIDLQVTWNHTILVCRYKEKDEGNYKGKNYTIAYKFIQNTLKTEIVNN
jgi:hypothetical protein